MIELFKQITKFMVVNKKYWMGPLIVIVFVVGSLLLLSQAALVYPFIYAIF